MWQLTAHVDGTRLTDTNLSGANRHDGLGVVASLNELIALRARGQTGLVMARQRPAIAATEPGAHFSQRKSRGMEFADARPYQIGDDARAIDWRQTARRGRPYTKLFQEEHERPVQLLVDLGPSMRFGTRNAFKSVVAARAAALLAWRAVAAGDRVGGLVWNGAELRARRPQGRHHGVLTLLASLATMSAAPPAAQALTLATPLRTLTRTRTQLCGLTVQQRRIGAERRPCDRAHCSDFDRSGRWPQAGSTGSGSADIGRVAGSRVCR